MNTSGNQTVTDILNNGTWNNTEMGRSRVSAVLGMIHNSSSTDEVITILKNGPWNNFQSGRSFSKRVIDEIIAH